MRDDLWVSRISSLPPLAPFAPSDSTDAIEPIPFSWPGYVALVDATGRLVREDKPGALTGDATGLLATLGLDADRWVLVALESRRPLQRALGAPGRLRAFAARVGQRWLHGQRAAQRLYSTLAA